MFHRIAQFVLLCSLPLLLALPAMSASDDKDKPAPDDKNKPAQEDKNKPAMDLSEAEVCTFVNAIEKATINIGKGWTELAHHYKLTVKSAFDGKVKEVLLLEERDGEGWQLLTHMKHGDLLRMTTRIKHNYTCVDSLKLYDLYPGEDRPNVYAFVETGENSDGQIPTTTVKLYKFGRIITMAVQNVRDKESGKLVPDPDLSHKIGKFGNIGKGDIVEITPKTGVATPTIKAIDLFAAPQSAVFAKLTETDVEGSKVPTIEVTIDAKATTILIPGKKDDKGKWNSDVALGAAVKRFKKGDNVTIRFRTDDKQNWLKEIAKDPNPKPAGKTEKKDKVATP